MIKLTNLVMTCGACPSQWEAETEDGRKFYARYRHGFFSAGVGSTLGDAIDGACLNPDFIEGDGENVTCFEHGHPLDGVMSTEEMLEHLREHVEV